MAIDVFLGFPWSSSFEWCDANGAPRVEASGSTIEAYVCHKLTHVRLAELTASWTDDALAQGTLGITAIESAKIPEGNVSEIIIIVTSGGTKYPIYDVEADDGINGVPI